MTNPVYRSVIKIIRIAARFLFGVGRLARTARLSPPTTGIARSERAVLQTARADPAQFVAGFHHMSIGIACAMVVEPAIR